MTITVIPDLHADLGRLDATLAAVSGPLAFLGDFIDGGADDRAVLKCVRGLIDGGAMAVIGNHELNAALFQRGLRENNEKNRKQHASFLAAFNEAERAEWTDWFLTLPLWRDLGGLRIVHACWSRPDIALIAQRRPNGLLHEDDLPEIAAESTPFGRAVQRIVSGPEMTLPAGHFFADKTGHPRTQMRVAWWRSDATTYREAALSVPDPLAIPDMPLPEGIRGEIYLEDAPPVLVGHYKMAGQPHVSGNAASLDYPALPCAYRWAGEAVLSDAGLILV
ncbi:metallophosphoesterase [Falsirhodobacter xinxiangensis]|uniref:metallophosphoesterase n=1 Tax=Falsirhodobacter xinxiangensis TaxID=2530049 RepID=UPI0010A9DF33|nr:metallophosphoesterase [Rhodobacter xinxiangensis]